MTKTSPHWTLKQEAKAKKLSLLAIEEHLAVEDCRAPTAIRWIEREQISATFLQMSHCKTSAACAARGECIAYLGSAHAEAALNGTECSYCESMSLALLHS